jgi:hypothetical protein
VWRSSGSKRHTLTPVLRGDYPTNEWWCQATVRLAIRTIDCQDRRAAGAVAVARDHGLPVDHGGIAERPLEPTVRGDCRVVSAAGLAWDCRAAGWRSGGHAGCSARVGCLRPLGYN